MTFGLIGLNWGKNYIKNINEAGGVVRGLCSSSINTYNNLDGSFKKGITYFTENYDFLINDKEIDTIIIATPPETHKDIILKCVKANKNIIVEKPIVTNLYELEEIKSALMGFKKKFLVNYIHLWNPGVTELRNKFNNTNILIETRGDKVRNNYSFLWDYASHDIAIALTLGTLSGLDIFENSINGYSFVLHFDGFDCQCDFIFGGVKSKEIKNKYYNFSDNRYNSMKDMLLNFINCDEFNNFNLAYQVTKIIDELESKSKNLCH